MKEFFKPVITDKILNRTFLYCALLIAITLLYVVIRFFNLPPFIPVFNQMPWGNDRIGPKFFIFIPLLTGILITTANAALASKIYSKSPILSRIFAITSILCVTLILIFSFVIITIIG